MSSYGLAVLRRATPCYARSVKTISQRELRNDSAEIMRALGRGESFRLTNHGRVVGRVVPDSAAELDDLVVRRARRSRDFADVPRVQVEESTDEVLRELRGDR